MLSALVAGLILTEEASAATLPAGFQETEVFTGLTSPTVVQFASDGRVFVAEKSGLIKVFENLADTTPTVFADLRTNVHNFWDRGLLGMALHPNFPATPYVYVLYTHDAAIGGTAPRWGTVGGTTDGCPTPPGATQDGCVVSGRLSRLQASGNVMTGAEQVLIEDWFQQYQTHSIGTLAFGPDGALYVSAGDGASATFADYGQDGDPTNPGGDPPVPVGGVQTPPTAEGGQLRSQDLRTSGDPTTLDGAILRLDPVTGAAMPGNPFFGSPDGNAARIIAYGLRNPFRFAIRPGTDEIWVGDVGRGSWEEINRIPDANDSVLENFGWPCYYGPGGNPSMSGLDLTLCESLYAQSGAVTSAYYLYNHAAQVVPGESCPTGGSSITGLAFQNGGNYPPAYDGALFFADYSRNCMWVILKGASAHPDPTLRQTFVAGAASPVDLKIGPGGDLFYVDLTGGKIRRIQYFGANQPPTAVIQASPQNGPVPLTVNFDGAGSSDPNPGDTLTYAWDLDGDSAYDDSTSAQPTRTYSVAGNFTAGLRVTDQLGASDTESVVISADNIPPSAAIAAPLPGVTWKVGDVIAFSGSASDAQDGALPASALSWSLVLQHCPTTCHPHPLQDFPGVASGSFAAPDHEYPSHLELVLTATDSGGLTDTANVLLFPDTVSLTFQSIPAGLQLSFGLEQAATPFSRTVIVGSHNSVTAPSPQISGPASYGFVSWSDGGAQSHDIVAGASPAMYVATYSSLPAPWLDQDIGAVAAAGSASHASGAFTVSGSGADIWDSADKFHYAYRPLSGDGEIVARVASIQNTNAWAKAGVMIREGLAANSANAMMLVTPSNGLRFQRRLTTGGVSTSTSGGIVTAPYWVKLVRSGSGLTGYKSADGVTWTQVGTVSIPMAGNVFIGLAVTSHNNPVLCAAVFDNVTVTLGTANAPPTVAVTSPAEGATSTAPATILINAAAADSDGTITQVSFHSGATLLGTDVASPYSFSWGSVAAGSYTLTAQATDNQSAVTTSSPVHVTVNPDGGALPAPWLSQDIGLVAVAGSASHSAGTFTVNGSGADIWDNMDKFRYVYRPLSGDGAIVARLVSVQNTNAWAKAGVMIRETLAANSANAMMLVTPGNGARFQRRVTAGGLSTSTSGGILTAPYWVKLVRGGGTLTGFKSPDGTTWTEVGSAAVSMANDVFIGLAVTSHNSPVLCTAVFDNVQAP